jgi:hypothetical protein
MQKGKSGNFYATENWLKSGKRECEICNQPLWQDTRDRGSKPKPGEKYPPKNPRMRLDQYIKRFYSDRVYMLIWDEAHECANGSSGNGEAFNRLATCANKVLAMTGTPFNGRASSLFNLEYALNPRIRQHYNWGGSRRFSPKEPGSPYFQEIISENSRQRGRSESRWVDRMGVREQIVEERPTYDSQTGVYTGTSTYEKPFQEAPGISPLLIAEVLDHSLFFSLGDLNKALPDYEEIALPIEMDADVAEVYDTTLSYLKDYMIQRRWEGDVSFRGAYLQWSMGFCNTAFMPYKVIHNLKDPFSGKKRAHTVKHLPSLGEERLYAKEQALIDLVQDELANNRPCVIYVRQTQTRDLQPRLAELLSKHVPDAKPFILKNTVQAERREKLINDTVASGANIIISNPELVRTGLDLLFAPTLIFFEPTFNLSTMMQAAARSYRLNQTHKLCKVYYMYYEQSMEHRAVQLMSRKQRAAKLLNGEIGLSGLDELTQGEGGLEEALLQAIGQEESLLDPTQLFKTDEISAQIDAEDMLFWNVEVEEDEPEQEDPLLTFAVKELGAVVKSDETPVKPVSKFASLRDYLKSVSLLKEAKFAKVQARILHAIEHGVPHPDDGMLMLAEGMKHPDFAKYPVHENVLTRWIAKVLRLEKAVLREDVLTVAQELVK